MRDYLALGPTPSGEDCEQLGPNYSPAKARAECKRFIAQLERKFGKDMPDGMYFGIKSNPHDFGTYLEVVIYFDADDRDQCDYAYAIEGDTPEFWNEEIKNERKL